MKKRIILGIVMVLLCMSLSVTSFALTEGDWEFQLLDGEVRITGYVGDGGHVVVPSEIYGRPVTDVNVGESSKNFGNVVSIEFPDTIRVINNGKFSEKLESVIIPEGVECIGWNAFYTCKNLSDISLPSTIKEIGGYAFYGCSSLDEINFPEGLEKVGGCAFYGTGFETLDLRGINPVFEGTTFRGCDELVSVIFGEGITEIPPAMFCECGALKEVVIPNTVTVIKSDAFKYCESLESIILPTSLKTIDYNAFSRCSSLKEIVVPYGTERLVDGAFGGCSSLEALYLPDTVKNMTMYSAPSDKCIIYCGENSYVAWYCKDKKLSYLTDNSVNSLITVYYNGTRISFHEQGQNPELINSRTLVPLRSIFEAMDAVVEWNQETKTATAMRDGVEISISIGEAVMLKDGERIAVDVPAQLINDRTMVPVRVIAEAFGAEVKWDNNGRAVLIEE